MAPPPDGSGPHTLLVADSEGYLRDGVRRWVTDELSAGAKVVYTAWLPQGPDSADQHWLLGPTGARGAREALARGQLDVVDIEAVIDATGGRAEELIGAQGQIARQALREGWQRVSMSAESPRRPMGEGEATELVTHERGLDELTRSLPLHSLCQLWAPVEKDTAIWETVGVHHRHLVDEGWSADGVPGTWLPRGDLDAHVARRFGAGLHAALSEVEQGRGAPAAPGQGRPASRDLHVDLSRVDFLDVACARLLVLAARSAPRDMRIVLHRPSRIVHRLVDAVEERGRPRQLVWSDETLEPDTDLFRSAR